MQFTTYIDLVIFPWGYQTDNVKESQCGVMERKKDKGIDSCAVQYGSNWVHEAKHLKNGKSECTCKKYADFKDKKSM